MAMNPRDFELIALSHVLTRYRLTGELPSISGQPFDINEFKTKLFAGVPNYDSDININIDTVKMQNTVVDCDNEHEHIDKTPEPEAKAQESVEASAPEQTDLPTTANTEPESSNSTTPEKSSISGKLFQFFTKDNKNESK